MFRPPGYPDEQPPSPEKLQAILEAQQRTALPMAEGAFGLSHVVISTILIIGGAVGIFLVAFGLRLTMAYFTVELVRVPAGIIDTKTQPAITTPFMFSDEMAYINSVDILHICGIWPGSQLPPELVKVPMAERPIALPASTYLLLNADSPKKSDSFGITEWSHGIYIRGVRYLIRNWMGTESQWYIPPHFREFLTVQIFAFASALVVLALFWRTPEKSGEPQLAKTPFLSLSEDRIVGFFAAFLMLVDPLLVGFSGLILTETLFTALMVLLLVVVVQRRFSYWQAAAATAIGVSMVYTRPAAVWFVLLILAWRVWQDRSRPAGMSAGGNIMGGEGTTPSGATAEKTTPWLAAGLWPGIVLAVVLVSHLPWMMRNAALPDGQFAMSSLSGLTLYDSLGPQATGWSNQTDFRKEAFIAGYQNEWQMNRYFRDKTWKALGENPLRLVTLIPFKLWATWSPKPNAELVASGTAAWVIAAWSILVYGLAGVGAWVLIRQGRGRLVLLLLTPAIAITVLHSIIVGSIRYRVPAIPGLELLAAYALLAGMRQMMVWSHSQPTARVRQELVVHRI